MIKTTHKGWRLLVFGDKTLYPLVDDIIENKLQGYLIKELKNNSRSRVLLIDLQGQKAVLKSPREKNTNKWIRFTTLYRRGEAFKVVRYLDKLIRRGFHTNKPLLAMEKRRFGMVVDSWILYKFKPGKTCDDSHYPSIVKTLNSFHEKNLLHGDPHVDNFMTTDQGIFTLDAKPKKPILGAISKYYEFLYLKKSAPDIEKHFNLPQNRLAYKIAHTYSSIYWLWRKSKKRRRQKQRENLHILIIRFSSIGDIILTTPVLAALKRKFPDAVIHFLTMDSYKAAISGNPDIDKLLLFDKNKWDGIFGIYKFSQTLRHTSYDLIIDLHSKIRSRLISLFISGKVLRYRKRALWKSILVPLGMVRYHVDNTIVRNYFKPLKKINVYFTDETLTFNYDPKDQDKLGQYKTAVVMAPGAANNTKQWPAQHFARLGKMLKENIVLIGGKNDYAKCEEIRQIIGSLCVNLAGKLSLKESGALISLSKYVVSNDSGPFHMARGTAKKAFVIFGPTDPGMFSYNDNSILIYAGVPCSPCSLHGDKVCPKGHFDCMALLTPEKVFKIVHSNL